MPNVTNVSNTKEAKQACTGTVSHKSLTGSHLNVQVLIQSLNRVLCPVSIIRVPVDDL